MTTTSLPPLSLNGSLRWDALQPLLPADAVDVLEVGTGLGAAGTRLARRYEHYLGLEPDRVAYEVARSRVDGFGEVRNERISDLGADERFDLVCAFEVIEHIADDAGALQDWVARLRPGGTLLLSTPAWAHRMAAADDAAGHFRRYDPQHLERMLRDAGLADVQVIRYGGVSGRLLELARNTAVRVRRGSAAGSHETRTAGSGRLFQPREGVTGTVTALAGVPLRLVARVAPGTGVGLVAAGRSPMS